MVVKKRYATLAYMKEGESNGETECIVEAVGYAEVGDVDVSCCAQFLEPKHCGDAEYVARDTHHPNDHYDNLKTKGGLTLHAIYIKRSVRTKFTLLNNT